MEFDVRLSWTGNVDWDRESAITAPRDIVGGDTYKQAVAAAALREHVPHYSSNHSLLHPTPLMGRVHALATGRDRLLQPSVRLLTLTGPDGVGKTRLARGIAQELHNTTGWPIFFIQLTALKDVAAIYSAIGDAFANDHEREASPVEWCAILRRMPCLLILDGCEQLSGTPAVLDALLSEFRLLKILATSRVSFRSRWQHEFPVAPLATPDLRHLPPAEILAEVPAVALFTERARAIHPEFTLTAENSSSVAELCVRLDGLPLALEHAAARLKVLTPSALLEQLVQDEADWIGQIDLHLLTIPGADNPARQDNLIAMYHASYEQIPPTDRLLLAQLAVCVGGCGLEVVEAIWGVPTAERTMTLRRLELLVDKGFLSREPTAAGRTQFRLLATFRQFLLERLRESGELAAAQHRHAAYALALAERAEPHLRSGVPATWIARLDQEYGNFCAALRWCQASGHISWGLRLGSALWRFWWHRGLLRAGQQVLEGLLAMPQQAILPPIRAAALCAAGNLAAKQGDYISARSFLVESLALWRTIPGDEQAMAMVLDDLGFVQYRQGEQIEAQRSYEASLVLARRIGFDYGTGRALNHLGLLALDTGDHAAARELFEEALPLFKTTDDTLNVAMSLCYLGSASLVAGALAPAQAWYERALSYTEHSGVRRARVMALAGLGEIAFVREEYESAHGFYAESLSTAHRDADYQGVINGIEGLAALAAACGEAARALRLAAAVDQLRIALGAPALPAEAARFARRLGRARRACSDDLRKALQVEGRIMSVDMAIEHALAGTSVASIPVTIGAVVAAERATSMEEPTEALTPREREVAALIALGHTNRRIAEALSITERTAGTHVTHILGKLVLTSRVQIAAWAIKHRVNELSE